MPPAPYRSTSFWDWIQAALLVGNLGWTTLQLGGYRAETRGVSLVLTGIALAWLLVRHACGAADSPPRWARLGGWFLPYLLYVVINVALVTPVEWLGWFDALGWIQLITTFCLALEVVDKRGPRHFVRLTVGLLGVVLVVMACYQRYVSSSWLVMGRTQSEYFSGRASGSFGAPNSLAVFLLMLIPPVLALAMRRGVRAETRALALFLGLVFSFGLLLTVSRGVWLALALALTIWPLLKRGWSWPFRLSAAVGIMGGICAMGATLYGVLPEVRERWDGLIKDAGEKTRPIMWNAAWRLWQEAPWVGSGAGSYNVLFERYRPEGFRDEPQWAHNDYLNTLSDYGVVGLTLFCGAGLMVGLRARPSRESGAKPGAVREGARVGLIGFGFALLVDYHLKLPALAMMVGYLAAEAVGPGENARPPPTQKPWLRWASGLGAGVVVFFMVTRVIPPFQAETTREAARGILDQLARQSASGTVEWTRIEMAHAELLRATAIDPTNAQAWMDRAYAATLLSGANDLRRQEWALEAESAAARGVVITTVAPEAWCRLGVALDLQNRWVEAGDAFGRALELAPHSAPVWFYQAYHLSLQPATRPLARAAVATCLRLDPGMGAAEALAGQLRPRP